MNLPDRIAIVLRFAPLGFGSSDALRLPEDLPAGPDDPLGVAFGIEHPCLTEPTLALYFATVA